MAVDAHHLPHLFSNREVMMNNNNMEEQSFCNNNNNNNNQYGVVFTDDPPPPLLYNPTTTYFPADESFFPSQSRKRTRDSTFYQNLSSANTTPFSFLGQNIDISSHINQQQHDIDRFVSLHMERVRYEIEEKRKKQARTIMEAIETGLVKRLRVKEEERERIGKLNHALEERVKSLSVENQIWRDLAQTNEATANNLRNNLEQVLAQVSVTNVRVGEEEEEEDDAESCCGSCSDEKEEEEETVVRRKVVAHDSGGRMWCRNCGEEESCVLILPCRHLCLCGTCGSSVHTCPICSSIKNASVHVNMSS